jgi:hypothetical protein
MVLRCQAKKFIPTSLLTTHPMFFMMTREECENTNRNNYEHTPVFALLPITNSQSPIMSSYLLLMRLVRGVL